MSDALLAGDAGYNSYGLDELVDYTPAIMSDADWAAMEQSWSGLSSADGAMRQDEYDAIQGRLTSEANQLAMFDSDLSSAATSDGFSFKGLLNSISGGAKDLGLTTADGKLSAMGTLAMVLGGNALKGMGEESMLDKSMKFKSDEAEKARQAEIEMYQMRTGNKGSVGTLDKQRLAKIQEAIQKKATSIQQGGTNSGLLATVQRA